MLFFDRHGTGIPIILIHAFPLDRRMWKHIHPDLSRNFQTVGFDLPGFGRSPGTSSPPSMENYAREIREALRHLKINQKIILAGISMGGYVAFELWRQFPEIIRSLILISTRSTADSDKVRAGRMENIKLVEEKGPAMLAEKMIPQLFGRTSREEENPLIKETEREIQETAPKGISNALRAMSLRRDSTPLLPKISVPSLVLWGEEDTLISKEETDLMAQKIPGSQKTIIPKAGHMVPLERPQEFLLEFRNFLKRNVL